MKRRQASAGLIAEERGGGHAFECVGALVLTLGAVVALQWVRAQSEQRIVGVADVVEASALSTRGAFPAEVPTTITPTVRAECAEVSLATLSSTLGVPVIAGAEGVVGPKLGFLNGAASAFQANNGGGAIFGDLFGVTDADLKYRLWDQPAQGALADLVNAAGQAAPAVWQAAPGAFVNMRDGAIAWVAEDFSALAHNGGNLATRGPVAMVQDWRVNRTTRLAGQAVDVLLIDSFRTMKNMGVDGWHGGGTMIAAVQSGDCAAFGETLRNGVNEAPETTLALMDAVPLAFAGVKALRGAALASRVTKALRTIDGVVARRLAALQKPALGKIVQCFTAGTEVHTQHGFTAIEKVKLGDRVRTFGTKNDEGTAVGESWRRIDIEMDDERSPNGKIRIALLRSPTWVRAAGARVGAAIDLSLEEMDVHGRARVLSIGDAPRIREGAGRVVLATIESESRTVLVLRFEGTNEILEATAGHRLYSLDRNEWIRSDELHIGERLRTRSGHAVIASIEHKPGKHRVYNLEVETEHNYLVSELGVLSHNDVPCGPLDAAPKLRWPSEATPPGESLGRRSYYDLVPKPTTKARRRWQSHFRYLSETRYVEERTFRGDRVVLRDTRTQQRYVFKPDRGWDGVQADTGSVVFLYRDAYLRPPAGSYILERLGFYTPAAWVAVWNGRLGSIQEFLEGTYVELGKRTSVLSHETEREIWDSLRREDVRGAHFVLGTSDPQFLVRVEDGKPRELVPIDLDYILPIVDGTPAAQAQGYLSLPSRISRDFHEHLAKLVADREAGDRMFAGFARDKEREGMFERAEYLLNEGRNGTVEVVDEVVR